MLRAKIRNLKKNISKKILSILNTDLPSVLLFPPPQLPRVERNPRGFLRRPGTRRYTSTFLEGTGVDGSGANCPGLDHRWKLFLRELYLDSKLKYQNLNRVQHASLKLAGFKTKDETWIIRALYNLVLKKTLQNKHFYI